MTTWDVYWILMLDRLVQASGIACCMSLIALILLASFGAMIRDIAEPDFKVVGKRMHRFGIPIASMLAIVFGLIATFLPDTKQAAVIYVLPRIATVENLEAAQGEASEIYGLAKAWLREQVGEKAEEEE